MVWIFWFIYMFKLKSLYFLCIISMVLWGMGVGWDFIKFNYIIFMYMYIKRKLKCCIMYIYDIVCYQFMFKLYVISLLLWYYDSWKEKKFYYVVYDVV